MLGLDLICSQLPEFLKVEAWSIDSGPLFFCRLNIERYKFPPKCCFSNVSRFLQHILIQVKIFCHFSWDPPLVFGLLRIMLLNFQMLTAFVIDL